MRKSVAVNNMTPCDAIRKSVEARLPDGNNRSNSRFASSRPMRHTRYSPDHWQWPGPDEVRQASKRQTRQQPSACGDGRRPGALATATGPFAVLEYTTLMIQQSREVHDDILRLIDAIERGDSRDHLQYMPMGRGMHRGMGGGFFSIQK